MSCCLIQSGWGSSWQLLWWSEGKEICFTARDKMRHFGPPRYLIPASQCCLCSWQLFPLINLLLALIFSHPTSTKHCPSFGKEEVEAGGVQMDAACTFNSFPWEAAACVIPCCAPLYCHSIANNQTFHMKTILCRRLSNELRTRNGRWLGEEIYY